MLPLFLILAVNQAQAADVAGQGVPRETESACTDAGLKIKGRLLELGFSAIEPACVGTNDDVGGYVPIYHAKAPTDLKTFQDIGQRRYGATAQSSCQNDLKALKAAVIAERLVESECLKGTEYDDNGNPVVFYQAWVTKLISTSQASIAPEKLDEGFRGPKKLPALRQSGPSGSNLFGDGTGTRST